MRLLLFFISILFSFIFYVFYLYSIWKNIFLDKLDVFYNIDVFSTNLIYEAIVFFVIWILFFVYLTDFKKEKELIKNKHKINFLINKEVFKLNFLTTTLLLISVLSFIGISYILKYFITSIYLVLFYLWFIYHIIFFFFLTKVKIFIFYKKILKIISLLFLYISSISWAYFLFNNDLNYLILWTIVYSISFNLRIHFKYSNIISLFFWIFWIIFLIFLFFIYK